MDPRAQRSRDRLFASALAAARAQPIATLTVTQLSAAAGVHRSTFYEHASSPVALVEAALTAQLDELRAGLLEDGTDAATAVTAVTEGVLRHILSHVAVYRRELADGGGTLHAMLSRHFRGSIALLLDRERVSIDIGEAHLGAGASAAPGDAVLADAAARFIADGTVGVIDGWLRHPQPRVDDFLRVYLALLPAWWPHRPAVDA